MNVAVEDRLPSGLAAVDSHVEPGDLGVTLPHPLASFLQKALDGIAFWLVEVEVVGDVTAGMASRWPLVTGKPSSIRKASEFSATISRPFESQKAHPGSRCV